MKKNILICLLILLLILLGVILLIKKGDKKNNDPLITDPKPINNPEKIDFDYKIIKNVNKNYKENYLISPLSIAYALSILNQGANNQTKDQIDKVLNNYKLIQNVNVEDKINIANGLFIKNNFKNDINSNYINTIKKSYDSDLIFDEFNTPDILNSWISDKTYKMIPKIVDKLDDKFVLGIVNTIAINVEWKNKFECSNTTNAKFKKIDNTLIDTPMMYTHNTASYIENNNAKGIIKDYAIYDTKTNEIVYEENNNTVSLEYIAILPNDTIDNYINNFDKKELDSLLKSKKDPNEKLDINLKLPKYTYDFNYNNFKKDLIDEGIIDVFDEDKSDLSNMINKNSDLKLYVSSARHKTHIELSENGTKAAAVTAFLVTYASAMNEEKQKIDIIFDRPFVYLIKEKNSDNIWFFGTVYEPMKWEDNTKCEVE